MRLETLISKLEAAAKKYERRCWESNCADLTALDLNELLSEAAKVLRAHQMPPFMMVGAASDFDAQAMIGSSGMGYIQYGSDAPNR
jgi:hypothetical protein